MEEEYKQGLEKLSIKLDKNSTWQNESLCRGQHNMFIEGDNLEKIYQETFETIKEDCLALEKVDLLDYWNRENDRRD